MLLQIFAVYLTLCAQFALSLSLISKLSQRKSTRMLQSNGVDLKRSPGILSYDALKPPQRDRLGLKMRLFGFDVWSELIKLWSKLF